jgi:Fe-S-cluster containining protein
VPIFYECERCTACCRWPGEVRLDDGEIARISAFLGVSEVEFIQKHTRVTQDRRGLALEDKANGECIFLQGQDCLVQPVKPRQCKEFPNLWNFPGFREVCRAIPREVSEEEYQQRVISNQSGSSQ